MKQSGICCVVFAVTLWHGGGTCLAQGSSQASQTVTFAVRPAHRLVFRESGTFTILSGGSKTISVDLKTPITKGRQPRITIGLDRPLPEGVDLQLRFHSDRPIHERRFSISSRPKQVDIRVMEDMSSVNTLSYSVSSVDEIPSNFDCSVILTITD
jgi:hypothetical protein